MRRTLSLLLLTSQVISVLSLPVQQSEPVDSTHVSLSSHNQQLNRYLTIKSWKSRLESLWDGQEGLLMELLSRASGPQPHRPGNNKASYANWLDRMVQSSSKSRTSSTSSADDTHTPIPTTEPIEMSAGRADLAHQTHSDVYSENKEPVPLGIQTSASYEHNLKGDVQASSDPELLLHAILTAAAAEAAEEEDDVHGSFIVPSKLSPELTPLSSSSTTKSNTSKKSLEHQSHAHPHRQHHPCNGSKQHIKGPSQGLKTIPSVWDLVTLSHRLGPEVIALGIFLLVPIAVFLVELIEMAVRRNRIERFPDRGRARVRLTGPERQLTAMAKLEREKVIAEQYGGAGRSWRR